MINHYQFVGRDHLTAMLSEDEGKTWKYKLLLDERADVSYPDAKEADDGYIYIQGTKDNNKLKYIWVKAIFEDLATDNNSKDVDEDDIMIPSWLVPQIKEYILKNELPFMLNRPSDDSNNATLASVKPHGPQDDQK